MSYNYELALILSAKLADEKQKKVLADVKKYITDASGKVTEDKLLGKKNLAYNIRKEAEGLYFMLKFSLEGKETAPLSNKIKLNEDILRYLIIRR